LLTEGEFAGNLACVLEVIDLNRVLIQGPAVPRQPYTIRRASLTPFKIAMPRGARTKTFTKVWTESGVEAKFAETEVAKKLARAALRKNLTDFDRFKVMLAQKKRSYILRA
jgi:large subunit ribosomal protein L14e